MENAEKKFHKKIYAQMYPFMMLSSFDGNRRFESHQSDNFSEADAVRKKNLLLN